MLLFVFDKRTRRNFPKDKVFRFI